MAVVAAPYNWTGFYVGVAGGGGWGTSHHSTAGVTDFSDNFKVSGGLIGGTVGYNWQSGALVFGVEGDASYATIKGSTTGVVAPFCPDGINPNCTTKLRGLETLRVRFGYAADRFMPYVTGGLAVGQIYAASDPGDVNSGSKSKATWTIGGGVEAAINRNWSAKAEYLYADFGTLSGIFIRQPGAFPFDVSLKTHIVRVGLNYRFN
ncbi:MAG: porin family protein [Rhizobiales bacterium]|nr:porin family protein [Hyphomicrobiales bacterium]